MLLEQRHMLLSCFQLVCMVLLALMSTPQSECRSAHCGHGHPCDGGTNPSHSSGEAAVASRSVHLRHTAMTHLHGMCMRTVFKCTAVQMHRYALCHTTGTGPCLWRSATNTCSQPLVLASKREAGLHGSSIHQQLEQQAGLPHCAASG